MRRLVITMVSIAALTGCAKPQIDDLKRFVEQKKSETPKTIDELPEVKQVETFLYEAGDRRDPFTPTLTPAESQPKVVESGIMPDFNRRKEELESYSLDTLKMVGTLEQDGVNWGLVQTSDNTIHRVRAGNYMGMNHGRIKQITEEKISLVEIVQDGLGGYRERPASLALTE